MAYLLRATGLMPPAAQHSLCHLGIQGQPGQGSPGLGSLGTSHITLVIVSVAVLLHAGSYTGLEDAPLQTAMLSSWLHTNLILALGRKQRTFIATYGV